MKTKQNTANATQPANSQGKKYSGTVLGAGMAAATAVGATVMGVVGNDATADEINENIQEQEDLKDDIEQNQQEEETAQQQQNGQQQQTVTEEESEEPDLDGGDVDTDDVVDRIIEQDEVEMPESPELEAVGWRDIVDADGEEMRLMVFRDSEGNEYAFAEAEPGSGMWNALVDPDTGMQMGIPFSSSYTRADFESLLNDNGDYMPIEPGDPMFAQNDDIAQDIIDTEGGDLMADNTTIPDDDELLVDIVQDDIEQADGSADAIEGWQGTIEELDDMLAQLIGDDAGADDGTDDNAEVSPDQDRELVLLEDNDLSEDDENFEEDLIG